MLAADAANSSSYPAVYGWIFFAFYYDKSCGWNLG